MIAFLLTFTLLAVWAFIGWAVVCPLNGGRNLIRNALLSPVVGASVVMLLVFQCNRLGLPVRVCGPPVTIVCCAMAAALIWRFRFPVPWRKLTPFLIVVMLAASLVGYPMLLYGFDWLSYGNDDMANYVLGADGFLKWGTLNSFDPRVVLESRDMGLVTWLMVTLSGIRCGSELTLAWVMSLTGLSGHQVFMPVIVAFELMLVCAAGALIIRNRRTRTASLMTCAWTAVSSLVVFGTVYQLISQVLGLTLLAGAGTLLLQSSRWTMRRAAVKRALLAALLCAAIGVAYPEVLPFLILAFGLTHLLALLRRRETFLSLAASTTVTIGAAAIVLNTFAGSVPSFLLHQAKFGLRAVSPADMLFPFYLLPSGLANFWGFLPIAQPVRQPEFDIAIGLGALCLAVAVPAVIWQAWRGQAAASFAMVMLVLAGRLASMPSDFGLYKLAMYIQPFLLGTLVLAWFGLRARFSGVAPGNCHRVSLRGEMLRKTALVLPLAIIGGLGLRATLRYVSVSAEWSWRGAFIEVPEASSHHLVSQLRSIGREPLSSLVVSDTPNVVVAKLEAAYLAPSKQEYAADDYFSMLDLDEVKKNWYADLVRPGYLSSARDIMRRRLAKRQQTAVFDMHGGPSNPFLRGPDRDGDSSFSLVASGPLLSVLNRRGIRPGSMVTLISSEQVDNYLIQVDSQLGANYFRSGSARKEGRVATFQLEPDFFYPGHLMVAVGPVILLEVLHPSPGVRLQMEYTASLKSDGENTIPPTQAIGAQRVPFGALGRGSARLFSPRLEPQTIAGRKYIAIDMGAAGRTFPEKRSGLMWWYGTSIPLDARWITGFLRDVSLIDANEYESLNAPARVAHFPEDLARKELEYSGIYEDGWVAERSFLQLKQPSQGMPLIVKAMVPAMRGAATTLRVFSGRDQVAQAALHPGENEVRTILEGPAGKRRIELQFDAATPLSAPDGRMISAKLEFVGFSESDGNKEEIAESPIGIGEHWYPFEKFGGQTFRWVENDARFAVEAPAPQSGELAIDFEPGPGMGGKPVALGLVLPNGGTRVLPAVTGRQMIRTPLALSGGTNRLFLRCEGGGRVIPGDPRKLNFRVFALTWTPGAHSQ